ncbi:hypothetical protein C1H46_034548 [Malus baccata]|uniref:Cytochrome P450 n=1 Tax=Malus baccata TaxID=106549 RepID=A0A540L0B0_MALBA|nr:hypothetical protein C1H46_034548 [Malus baccata]
MLSNTTLDSVYALQEKQLRRTVRYFYDRIGSPINVGEQMFLNVMNVITNMLWGRIVQEDEKAGLGAEFREVVSEMMELLGKPNVSDFYPGLARFDLQGVVKKMGWLARRFDGIFEKIIDQRLRIDKEGEEGNKDFFYIFVEIKGGRRRFQDAFDHDSSQSLAHGGHQCGSTGLVNCSDPDLPTR